VSKPSVIVVGSGAGASVAAWEFARAGHPVLVFEKGRNLLPGLGQPGGPGAGAFANDEVKTGRYFENQDVNLEPRTARTQDDAAKGKARTFVGDVNTLPTTVGGGTIHWDAKTPRFWKQDFKGRSLYGPVPDANVADWPLTYEDLAPYYDEIEERLGVQGEVARMPARTLEQAPRSRPFPMPPNPAMYVGSLLAQGAAAVGATAYPFPMAVNSQPYDGRPRCNSCGFCSGFGCPIGARGGAAVSFLHHALAGGVELRPRCFVSRIDLAPGGARAIGVTYLDPEGVERHERADIVVLAPSAIETARLALLSATADHPDGLGNRSGQLGRNLMFHFFTIAGAFFAEDPHAWRGPSTTFVIDDFVGPDVVPAAAAAGLPYLKGGICETGGTPSPGPLAEAQFYTSIAPVFGVALKRLMRTSPWRSHIAGLSMVGEDLPQLANVVDLDPAIRDVYGLPVPRITHSAHRFETVASAYYGPQLSALCAAAPGALGGGFIPIAALGEATGNQDLAGPAATAHIMGTARMGDDPSTSVVDAWGRMHDVDNVYVADGSVFTSAGGFNPTLTIMALALRMARHVTGAAGPGAPTVDRSGEALAVTGRSDTAAVMAAVGAAAAVGLRRAVASPAPVDHDRSHHG
jgi:choline dehydrogenase-like flavoprotein